MRIPPALAAVALVLCSCSPTQPQSKSRETREREVRAAVQEFYSSFDDGFTKPADYATEDWYHINPYGAVDKGRDATLKTVRGVHQTFLRGTTDQVKDIDVRFATGDVAVATATSEMSPFTSPDGVNHAVEGHIRTFVLVNQGGRWRMMQDHNTTIVPPPAAAAGRAVGETQSKYTLESAKWGLPYSGPEGYPKGARRAVLTTDPTTNGDTYFAHFPAGTKFESHWHSNGEYAVLLQGKVTHVTGAKRTPLKIGDYVAIPAKTNHGWETDSASDAYLLIRRDGPMDVNFVKR